jgi:hypothetical protein
MRVHVLTAERPARPGETLDHLYYDGTPYETVADGTEWKGWRVFPVWAAMLTVPLAELIQEQACQYLECELGEITWRCEPTDHEIAVAT